MKKISATTSTTSVLLLACALALGLAACGDDAAPGDDDIDATTGGPDGSTTTDGPTAMIDAPTGGTIDATTGGTVDAGGMSTVDGSVGVDCGGVMCSPTEECCVTMGMGGTPMSACVATGTCMGGTVGCDGPEDCAGNACCGTISPGGMTGSTMCSMDVACGGMSLQLCHTNTDCPASGMGTGMCCPPPMGSPSGYCAFMGFCPF